MPYLISIHYITFLTHERWIEDVARSRNIYCDQCRVIEEKQKEEANIVKHCGKLYSNNFKFKWKIFFKK
jgi:hypothetical protein